MSNAALTVICTICGAGTIILASWALHRAHRRANTQLRDEITQLRREITQLRREIGCDRAERIARHHTDANLPPPKRRRHGFGIYDGLGAAALIAAGSWAWRHLRVYPAYAATLATASMATTPLVIADTPHTPAPPPPAVESPLPTESAPPDDGLDEEESEEDGGDALVVEAVDTTEEPPLEAEEAADPAAEEETGTGNSGAPPAPGPPETVPPGPPGGDPPGLPGGDPPGNGPPADTPPHRGSLLCVGAHVDPITDIDLCLP